MAGTVLPKQVTFGNIEVRKYEMILGDNPATRKGLPITIDWKHFETTSSPLEIHEFINRVRGNTKGGSSSRKKPNRLNREYRHNYLTSLGIYSSADFLEVLLETTKIQESRKENAGAENLEKFNDFFETSAKGINMAVGVTFNAVRKSLVFGDTTVNALNKSARVLGDTTASAVSRSARAIGDSSNKVVKVTAGAGNSMLRGSVVVAESVVTAAKATTQAAVTAGKVTTHAMGEATKAAQAVGNATTNAASNVAKATTNVATASAKTFATVVWAPLDLIHGTANRRRATSKSPPLSPKTPPPKKATWSPTSARKPSVSPIPLEWSDDEEFDEDELDGNDITSGGMRNGSWRHGASNRRSVSGKPTLDGGTATTKPPPLSPKTPPLTPKTTPKKATWSPTSVDKPSVSPTPSTTSCTATIPMEWSDEEEFDEDEHDGNGITSGGMRSGSWRHGASSSSIPVSSSHHDLLVAASSTLLPADDQSLREI